MGTNSKSSAGVFSAKVIEFPTVAPVRCPGAQTRVPGHLKPNTVWGFRFVSPPGFADPRRRNIINMYSKNSRRTVARRMNALQIGAK